MDQELIFHQNKAQINKDNIHKNIKSDDRDYKVGDKFVLNNNAACKYKTPYKGPFFITQCWTNVLVVLQCGAIKIRCNICHMEPYTSVANVEDITPENMCDNVNI